MKTTKLYELKNVIKHSVDSNESCRRLFKLTSDEADKLNYALATNGASERYVEITSDVNYCEYI